MTPLMELETRINTSFFKPINSKQINITQKHLPRMGEASLCVVFGTPSVVFGTNTGEAQI